MSHEEALGFSQIILTLLVFALGIPALVLEATAEERIRHLLHRRVPHVPMMILMAVTLLIVGGLVWFSDDDQSSAVPAAGLAAKAPPQSMPSTKEKAQLRPRKQEKAQSVSRVKGKALLGLTAEEFERTAKILTVTLLVLYAAFWLFMLKTDIRSLIVRWIAVRLRWRFRFRRKIKGADADDLVVLGESAPSEFEKNLVLTKIHQVICDVADTDGYDGTALTPLLNGLTKIAASEYRPGTAQTYLKAVDIVGDTWQKLQPVSRKRDGVNLIETACRLGEAPVKAGHENVAHALIDTMSKEKKVLFRIGLASLRHERYRVAVTALNKLEVAADETNALPKELIGLVAYFCAAGTHAAAFGHGFRRRLDYQYADEEIRAAASRAENEFSQIAEYGIADTIATQKNMLTAATFGTSGLRGTQA